MVSEYNLLNVLTASEVRVIMELILACTIATVFMLIDILLFVVYSDRCIRRIWHFLPGGGILMCLIYSCRVGGLRQPTNKQHKQEEHNGR